MTKEFCLTEINRIVYIWARYEGKRDSTKEGKHYDEVDIAELIMRLQKFKKNPESFEEGFEKKDKEG